MDLEVDDRGCEAEPKIINTDYREKVLALTLTNDSVAREQSPPILPPRPRQKSPIWLFAVFTIAIALAAVAGGVAGSLAMHRQSELRSCINANSVLRTQINSSCTTGVASPTAPKTSNTTAPSIRDVKPTSDCQTIPSSFASVGATMFTTYCKTDMNSAGVDGVHDFVGVYVYTFEDCINACSIFNDYALSDRGNLTCYGISYNLASGPDKGNCWFKGSKNIPFYHSNAVDSAVLDLN